VPYTANISSGNLIHNPLIKRLDYIGFQYYTAPSAPTSGIQNAPMTVNIPNIGPDRILYAGAVTTRGTAGPSFSNATFNGRTMTQLASTGSSPTKPIVWYGIRINNNETTGTFLWNETGPNVRSMACWFYISRGMRSTGVFSGNNGSASGTSGPATITQTVSVNTSSPGYDRSTTLMIAVKGIPDTGGINEYSGTNMSELVTNNQYVMSSSNSMRVVHSRTTNTIGSSGPVPQTTSIIFTSNTLPTAFGASIVIY